MTKIIIVTGVSRGIGKAIVDVLLEKHDVIVYGIDIVQEGLTALKNKYGNRFEYVTGSVTDQDSLEALVNLALSKYGDIDSVIANAGVVEISEVKKGAMSKWHHLFDVNLFSVANLVKLTMESVAKTKGNYVFVTSGTSIGVHKFLAAYGGSKAALNVLADAIAVENTDVRAMAVGPGVVKTHMYDPFIDIYKNLNNFTDADFLEQVGKVNPPEAPARVLANIALQGIEEKVNGKYYEFDDPALAAYR